MSSVLKVDQIQSDTGTVNVASKIEFPAGTVSAPSIFPTGDTNTGIFFPAADTAAIATNGTERFRVNTTGIDVTGTVVADGSITISDGTVAQLILDDTGQAQDWSIKAQSNYVGFFYGATQVIEIDNSSNLLFNSGYGSVATAYGCRAWVVFNGTGAVAVRASGNISSITDNGTGDYTVNFTTAMPDINYSVGGNGAGTINSDSCGPAGLEGATNYRDTTSLRFGFWYFTSNSKTDRDYINLQIFR